MQKNKKNNNPVFSFIKCEKYILNGKTITWYLSYNLYTDLNTV